MRGLACIVVFCLGAWLTDAMFVKGSCPQPTHNFKPFDIERYKGLWYTQYRSPFNDHVRDCTTTLIFLDKETGWYMKTFTLSKVKRAVVSKRFVIFNDHKTGIFRTRPLGVEGYRIPITNWILETDYDTYSVRYSCYNKSSDSHQIISLQTREQFPSELLLYNIRIILSTAGFSLNHVERVKQKKCPNMVAEAPDDKEDDDD